MVCECCGRSDGEFQSMCGFGPNCVPCLSAALTGEESSEHRDRHTVTLRMDGLYGPEPVFRIRVDDEHPDEDAAFRFEQRGVG